MTFTCDLNIDLIMFEPPFLSSYFMNLIHFWHINHSVQGCFSFLPNILSFLDQECYKFFEGYPNNVSPDLPF